MQLFLFWPVQLSACRYTSVSPRPWCWLITVFAPLPQSPASSPRKSPGGGWLHNEHQRLSTSEASKRRSAQAAEDHTGNVLVEHNRTNNVLFRSYLQGFLCAWGSGGVKVPFSVKHLRRLVDNHHKLLCNYYDRSNCTCVRWSSAALRVELLSHSWLLADSRECSS